MFEQEGKKISQNTCTKYVNEVNHLLERHAELRGHLSTNQVDSAEQTLRVLLGGVGESRPDQVAFLRDLEMLTSTVRSLRDRLDVNESVNQSINQSINEPMNE